VKTGLVLVAVLALAGCETTTTGGGGPVEGKPVSAANVPAPVKAEMERRGLPLDLLIEDSNGCWGLEVEVTTPRSGVQLKGPDGNQICA
jgi:hypothetical protein